MRKIFKVKVDKTNKFLLFVIGISIILLSLVVGVTLSIVLGLNELLSEILMECLLVAFSILILVFFPNLFCENEVEAEFNQDHVIFMKDNSEKTIYYNDIAEVQKTMILNRMHEEKGYYRMRVKHKGGCYVLYSTEKEYDERLDFEQVELSDLYFELKRRGVKCC